MYVLYIYAICQRNLPAPTELPGVRYDSLIHRENYNEYPYLRTEYEIGSS